MDTKKYKYKDKKIYWDSFQLTFNDLKKDENSKAQKLIFIPKRSKRLPNIHRKEPKILVSYKLFTIIIIPTLLLFLIFFLSNIINIKKKTTSSIFELGKEKTSVLENYLLTKDNIEHDRPVDSPFTPISFSRYRIKKGDTVESVAKKFGLTADTIILTNNIRNHSSLRAGDIINIPNQEGRLITVKENDSLLKIAKIYGTTWQKIADVNNLKSGKLYAGVKLFIPDAQMTTYERNKFYQQNFIWPVVGKITSFFGSRIDPFTQLYSFHTGIDIKGKIGDKVKCTKDGKVVFTGFHNIYGNFIMIKHSDGTITNYAHLDKVIASINSDIKQGEVIGLLGDTGRTTGPHLHFEIIKNGKYLNPLNYLK